MNFVCMVIRERTRIIRVRCWIPVSQRRVRVNVGVDVRRISGEQFKIDLIVIRGAGVGRRSIQE